jgi:DNA-binding NarL/FixJ family response regulator
VPNARTVVVTLAPLLRDIIKALVTDLITLDVVADFGSRGEIAQDLALMRPDLILIGLEPGETDEVGLNLLTQVPAAKVIAISNDGRDAYIHEMRPSRTVLSSVSPKDLVAAIASIAARI